MKPILSLLYGPEDAAGAGGGTTENAAGSSAAGASSGVTSTGNISSGTASEAMLKAAAAASSAEEAGSGAGAGAGAPGATAAATGQPAQGETKPETPPAADPTKPTQETGPVPPERHIAAVKNARTEGFNEAKTRYENAFGWVRDLGTPKQVRSAVELAKAVAEVGPVEFAKQLLRESNVDIRTLIEGNGNGSSPTGDEAFPEPDMVSKDGRFKTYSHGAMLKAMEIQAAKLRREFQSSLKPIQDANASAEEAARDAESQRQAAEMTKTTMTRFRAQPHWPTTKEGEAEVAAIVRAMPVEYRKQVGAVAALWEAFETYKTQKVYPTLGATAEAKVRADNAKKAAASVGAHPTGAGDVTKPKLRDGDINGLASHMERMAAAGV